MADYIIKNGPDLPEGVDAAEFEQEDGRIVCEYSTIGDRVFIEERPLRVRQCVNSDDKSVRVCLIRKPPQPPAWQVPAVLQGDEWRGFRLVKSSTSISVSRDLGYESVVISDGSATPFGEHLKLTADDFCGMQYKQHYLLGPQPKPAWKCTGKLEGSGAYLTYQEVSDSRWRLFFVKPEMFGSGNWWAGGGASACSGTSQWEIASALIGPLPDVDGVPVEERIWKL